MKPSNIDTKTSIGKIKYFYNRILYSFCSILPFDIEYRGRIFIVFITFLPLSFIFCSLLPATRFMNLVCVVVYVIFVEIICSKWNKYGEIGKYFA